jgi:hypothetical protein
MASGLRCNWRPPVSISPLGRWDADGLGLNQVHQIMTAASMTVAAKLAASLS